MAHYMNVVSSESMEPVLSKGDLVIIDIIRVNRSGGCYNL